MILINLLDRLKLQSNQERRKLSKMSQNKSAQMLKETCNCDDKRISKERISEFVVKQFDKKTDEYTQKELKPKDIF